MDSLLAIVRRLTLLVALLVLGTFARSADATTYAQAQSACQTAANTSWPTGNSGGWTTVCKVRSDTSQPVGSQYWFSAFQQYNGSGSPGWIGGAYYFDGVFPPSTACTTIPVVAHTALQGKVLANFTNQQTVTDSDTGQSVKCTIRWTPLSPPTLAYGKWTTLAMGVADASPAGGTGVDGKFLAPSGSAPDPAVPDLAAPATTSAAPSVCTGTCYNPNTDTYSFSDGAGHTISVDGNTARSASGGCSSSGTGTLCAGSPSAPAPPAPPSSPITDPATQVRSNDQLVQADPVTGKNQTVSTVTYGVPGSTPTSGQKSGDIGPAPASTAPTPPGTFGGGGDCNSPPSCTGDAVLCGVAREEWTHMCSAKTSADQLYKAVAGDGNGPSTFAADQTKYNQSSAWGSPDTSLDGTVGGQANSGVYDQSGFGFHTSCPLTDLSVPFFGGSFAIPLSQGCVIGPWLRAVIVGFALFSAAVITAGGRG